MTPPEPRPALLALRERIGAPAAAVRVLRHDSACGGASASSGLLASLDLGVPVIEAACDGACWAAPAATVQRPGHRHRFARLDRGGLADLTACVRGACDEPQAGSGEGGATARMGRTDGTLADVLAQGGYLAYALAAALPPARIIEVATAAALLDRVETSWVADRWADASVRGARVLLVRAPGGVIDTHLVEGDPHRLIEGVLIACRATGIHAARIGVERSGSLEALRRAIADATAAGILDGSALGGDAVAIEVVPLAGDLPRAGLYEVPVDGNMTWAGVLAMAGVAPARVQALRLGTSGRLIPRDDLDRLLHVRDLEPEGAVVLGPGAVIEGAAR